MKRAAILILAAIPPLAAACTSGGAEPAPTPAPPMDSVCKGEGLDAFVGRTADPATGAEMLAMSGARSLRWAGPGMAVTMDFRQDRLTVSYDRDMKITRASCG